VGAYGESPLLSPPDLYPCCWSTVVRVEGRVIIGRSHARMYSSSVRRQIVARLRSGEPVAVVAAETGVGQATLFRWKRQALIDAGVIEGIPSVEADELAAAHERIAALEAELALTRDTCEPVDAEAVVPPKR
jgi:putative transposase